MTSLKNRQPPRIPPSDQALMHAIRILSSFNR